MKLIEFTPKRDYIFEMCTTVNGRYLVIRDEVFDMQEQVTIGNIWSSIDVFKTIFKNVELEDKNYKIIQENILSLPILEGKENLFELRNLLLEFNFFDDTWIGHEFKSAGQSFVDFSNTSWAGIKKFGVSISQGDWSNILNLLAKGFKYVLRKLKDALYSNIGMVIDGILIATGIGKSVQWVPWILVTALDMEQILFNDWTDEDLNTPFWYRCMFLGFDILGLVSGAAAIGARSLFLPLSKMTIKDASVYISKNPKLDSIIQTMINSSSKVKPLINSLLEKLKSSFPKGAEFVSNIMSRIDEILSQFVQTLKELHGTTPHKIVKSGTQTGSILYGGEQIVKKVEPWFSPKNDKNTLVNALVGNKNYVPQKGMDY